MLRGGLMYVVYIDVLFIINWVMDVLIFFGVSVVLNKRIKCWSVLLAGAMAALVYCMLVVIPVLQRLPYWIDALVIPIPSILMLYKPTQYKAFFKEYIVSIVIAAIYGGIIFNIWYVCVGVQIHVRSMSIVLLLAIGFGVACFFYMSFYFIRRQFIFPVFAYHLQIHNQGRQIELDALLDTGNFLYTPKRHEPVLIVEYTPLKPLLTDSQRNHYEQFQKATLSEIEGGITEGIYSMDALIPFNSVGCKNGFLWGIRVDSVCIQKQLKKILVSPCIIGVASEALFTDGQFHALLHPEFILEEEIAS